MSMTVMRNIDCHIMSLFSLANYIAAPSSKRKAISTTASWISSVVRIPRKRRRTSGASARLLGVVDLLLECQVAPMVNYLRADLDRLLPLRDQRPMLEILGTCQLPLMAPSRPPVAQNRLPLFPQHRTLSQGLEGWSNRPLFERFWGIECTFQRWCTC